MRALSQLLVLLLVFIDSAAPALPTLPVSRAPAPTLSHSRSLVRSSSASSTLSASRAWVEDALAPSTASIQKAGAMPFLTVDPTNNTLSLNPNALQALSELPAPVCVLSVAGAAHEGKSSLLNMLSHWITERWPTRQGAGADFKVASSLFDGGTEGAWLRVFSGREGPLPGTECNALALIDAPGASNVLSLDADADDADVAAHRLFTLSTLASSTVALNIMSPVLNQLHQLTPLVQATKRSLLGAFNEFTLADLPGLVVVARDAANPITGTVPDATNTSPTPPDSPMAQTAPPPPPASAAQALEVAQLEYAMLMPRGDALDATKKALRTLFPLERSVVQIGMPDERDLDALSAGELPPYYVIPGLPLSGHRPFYASFDAAAKATLGALRPKSLGGHALPGRVLADALVSLVDKVNVDATPSMQKAVYASLDTQAKAAVTAGVRSGIDALRAALLSPPAAGTTGTEGDAMLPTSALRGVTASGEVLTEALLEQTLANATETAYDTFLANAPAFGAEVAGEPPAWLQPYAHSLLREMRRIQDEATSAMSRARRQEAAVERRVMQRLREHTQLASAIRKRDDEDLAAAHAADSTRRRGRRAARRGEQSGRTRRLLTGLALLVLSAGASALLPPTAVLTQLAPLAASVATPIVAQGPTVLAMVGVYRVAQRPVARAVGAAVSNVRAAAARADAWLRALAPAPIPAHAI